MFPQGGFVGGSRRKGPASTPRRVPPSDRSLAASGGKAGGSLPLDSAAGIAPDVGGNMGVGRSGSVGVGGGRSLGDHLAALEGCDRALSDGRGGVGAVPPSGKGGGGGGGGHERFLRSDAGRDGPPGDESLSGDLRSRALLPHVSDAHLPPTTTANSTTTNISNAKRVARSLPGRIPSK